MHSLAGTIWLYFQQFQIAQSTSVWPPKFSVMDYSIAQPSIFNRNWWPESHLSIDVDFHMTTKFSSHGLLYCAFDCNRFKSYGTKLKAFGISASLTSSTYKYMRIINENLHSGSKFASANQLAA